MKIRSYEFTGARTGGKYARLIRFSAAVILSAGLALSGIVIAGYLLGSASDMDKIDEARKIYYAAAVNPPAAPASDDQEPATDAEPLPDTYSKAAMDAYEALLNINAEAAGWLSIPGTEIDYPMAQANNNVYYLSHNFNREKSGHGSVFMDFENKPGDLSTVLYGHNMRDGTFFGKLSLFEDEKYCAEHPIIELNLRGTNTIWRIFSVHKAEDELVPVTFDSAEQFNEFTNRMKSLSAFDTGVEIGAGDPILTLSTCDGGNSRLLVHAVKVEG